MPSTVRVKGYTEVVRGLADADRKSRLAVRAVLRHAGDAVKTEASERFSRYDNRTAAGYRTIVRQRGVSVEQSIRRTTGLRGDFGKLQMRKALLPAAEEKQPETEQAMEHALDVIADTFNRGGA